MQRSLQRPQGSGKRRNGSGIVTLTASAKGNVVREVSGEEGVVERHSLIDIHHATRGPHLENSIVADTLDPHHGVVPRRRREATTMALHDETQIHTSPGEGVVGIAMTIADAHLHHVDDH